MTSTAVPIQIFIEKWHVSLNADFFVFSSLHIALLNFFKEIRTRHISKGRTITAYLPAAFKTYRKANEIEKVAAPLSNQKQIKIGRCTFLQSLHPCIEKSLESLTFHAEQGIVCENADGFRDHIHFVLSSLIADLLGKEAMLFFKRQTSTSVPCRVDHVQKKHPLLSNLRERRTIHQI